MRGRRKEERCAGRRSVNGWETDQWMEAAEGIGSRGAERKKEVGWRKKEKAASIG